MSHHLDSELARQNPHLMRDTVAVIAAMGTTDRPEEHAEQVRDTLFPDILRYAIGTDAHFGRERRNGRGLHEPTPEVMFELVLGTPVGMGLDGPFAAPRTEFPYLPAAVGR